MELTFRQRRSMGLAGYHGQLPSHVLRHVAAFCGAPQVFRPRKDLHVLRCPNKPNVDVTTYVTAGLSRSVLAAPKHFPVRQELAFFCDGKLDAYDVVSWLALMASQVAESRRAVTHGRIIELRDAPRASQLTQWAYVASPAFFKPAFFRVTDSWPPTDLVRVVPLSADEAIFVRRWGWSLFERPNPGALESGCGPKALL